MVKCWSSAPSQRQTVREVVILVDMFFSVDADTVVLVRVSLTGILVTCTLVYLRDTS